MEHGPQDYKYRICQSITGRHVIFGCDYDSYWEPRENFLGQPIFIEGVDNAGLPFSTVSIDNVDYVSVTHLKPESVYQTIISLKVLCKSVAPDLVIDNEPTILRTLCCVPKSSVIRTIYSTDCTSIVQSANGIVEKKIIDLQKILEPYSACLGAIGSRVFNPSVQADLDLVILAKDVSTLNSIWKDIRNSTKVTSNGYIAEQWPLTLREDGGLILDFFFNPTEKPPSFYKQLANSEINNRSFEFHEQVLDATESFLAIPAWSTRSGKLLIGADSALRGRFPVSSELIGKGVLSKFQDNEFIIIETPDNILRIK